MSWCAWSHENTFSSFQRGKCAACFPFLSFCILAFYQNTIRRICPSASHLSFPQDIRKRDFPFFLESLVCFFPCADARSKSACLLPVFYAQESVLMFRVISVWKEAAKASGLLSDSLPFIRAAIRSIHPLCSPRSTPTWPFDVKPPTRESWKDSCRPASRKLAPTMSVSSYSYVCMKEK